MNKIGVAILEDNFELLRELRDLVNETGRAEVLVTATTSEDFMKKVRQTNGIELLLLDIELIGDSMSGLEVAAKLKRPVLFVSGKTRDNLAAIEDLNFSGDTIIEHLTKPMTADKLNRVLPKMAERIHQHNQASEISLKLERGSFLKVPIDSIVYVTTAQGQAGRSSNKVVHFIHRKPTQLIDVSFKDIENIGLSINRFPAISQSHRVNVKSILAYDRNEHTAAVRAMNESGEVEEVALKVSDNYQLAIRARLR